MSQENPYFTPAAPEPPARPPASIGLLHHVRAIGVLMVVQGVACTVFGVGMLIFLFTMFEQVLRNNPAMQGGPGAPPPEMMRQILYGTYLGMGLGGLIPGVLYVAAGIMVFLFRGRLFGIIALAVGLFSSFTCYCGPTALGLAVYGLVVLLDGSVAAGFRMVRAGRTVNEVLVQAERDAK